MDEPAATAPPASAHRPRVSVVLPAFDAERYLAAAVESILAQTLADFELVVIDDGSTDATGSILAACAARDGRVRVVSRENRGLTRSLNEGLAHARAPLVAIMNADDVALPERLARQAAFLDAHPRVAAIGGQSRFILGGEAAAEPAPGPVTRLPTDPAAVRRLLATASPLAHPAVMMRRQAVLDAGGYRPALEPAEDYDLWLRLAERHDLANLPEVVLHYRLHAAQATAASFVRVAAATLAARALAARRARGEADPVPAASARIEPVERLAAELGVSPADVARQAIEAALGRAELLLRCGVPLGDVRGVLTAVATSDVAAAQPAFARAASLWLDGRIAAARGRWLVAAWLLGRAALTAREFRERLLRKIRPRR